VGRHHREKNRQPGLVGLAATGDEPMGVMPAQVKPDGRMAFQQPVKIGFFEPKQVGIEDDPDSGRALLIG
jgi:hypothetical protein